MVKVLPEEKITPADELRSLLGECERALGKLRGSSSNALSILHGLDCIAELLPQLEARGVDLRPEQARLSTLHGQLRHKAAALLRELRTSGGLAAARQTVQPDSSRWWWYLDEEVRAARRRGLQRLLLSLLVLAALLAAAFALYRRFLAPDPLTAQVQALQLEAEQFLDQGDYTAALARFEEAQALRPDSVELHLWRGALYELTGQEEKAAEAFTAARALSEAIAFHMGRGQVYVRLGQGEKALAEAQAILETDPQSPRGYYLLGNAFELQGRVAEALTAYEQASRLAEARNEVELMALARVRMAFLMQQGIPLFTPTPGP